MVWWQQQQFPRHGRWRRMENTVNHLRPASGARVRQQCWGYSAGCGMLNGLVIALIEVVFPPQSTYWYIS